jgi:hypothetical protein
MAAYMPSFMSKHLSTGAEAAFGQPLAFTTGAKTAAGTTPKSGKEKKKNTKKRKEKKAKAAKKAEPAKSAKPTNGRHIKALILSDTSQIEWDAISLTNMEEKAEAFSSSQNMGSLHAALHDANVTNLRGKIQILKNYSKYNSLMKRMEKKLEYLEEKSSAEDTDSQKWPDSAFNDFKNIYKTYYTSRMQRMQSTDKTNMHAQLEQLYSILKMALYAFYDKNPGLKRERRKKQV